MQINLFNRQSAPANFPNIRGSFSEISESEGTVSKVVALVKAMILLPINFIKDVAYHVAKPFKKAAESTFKDKVFVALNIAKENVKEAAERTKEFIGENKEKIAKGSVAATVATAIGYVAYQKLKPEPVTNWWKYATYAAYVVSGVAVIGGAKKVGPTAALRKAKALMPSSCSSSSCCKKSKAPVEPERPKRTDRTDRTDRTEDN